MGGTYAPTLPVGEGRRKRWWEPHEHPGYKCRLGSSDAEQEQQGQQRGKDRQGGAPLRQQRVQFEWEGSQTLQPSSAWEPACLQAVGAWAEYIMQMPGQKLPGQSNVLNDQCSTCWVVSWEGLGRKQLDWCGGPQQRAE